MNLPHFWYSVNRYSSIRSVICCDLTCQFPPESKNGPKRCLQICSNMLLIFFCLRLYFFLREGGMVRMNNILNLRIYYWLKTLLCAKQPWRQFWQCLNRNWFLLIWLSISPWFGVSSNTRQNIHGLSCLLWTATTFPDVSHQKYQAIKSHNLTSVWSHLIGQFYLNFYIAELTCFFSV